MTASVAYYSIVFLIFLFLIGRVLVFQSLFIVERKDIRNSFFILCLGLIGWSFTTVISGVVTNPVVDCIALYIQEFIRLGTIIAGMELCAAITDRTLKKKDTLYALSSVLLYLGIIMLAFRLFSEHASVKTEMFGKYLSIGKNLSVALYVLFYITVLFFYATYTYMYHYTCNKKREFYISKQCVIIVCILSICLFIEILSYIEYDMFIPTMYFGVLICISIFKNLILYKRSIEYNESDYSRILAPSYQKPSFVCNDEGRIIYENTRAFVMRQTYKDEYVGKFLTDIFDISDYDKERLKESRITQTFEVYCKYPKEPKEMLLCVKHNLDKYGAIFATEVEVEFAKNQEEDILVSSSDNDNMANRQSEDVHISNEETYSLRIAEIISQIEIQKDLYDKDNRILFTYNIKGISKAASVLNLSALEELCGRIQTELLYGEWESLAPMIIELDRQYESLKLIN